MRGQPDDREPDGAATTPTRASWSPSGSAWSPVSSTPTWSEIISGHWNDRWDISYGSGAINSDRASRLYFTQPYYAAPQLFFVAKNSKFQKPSDLDGKNIGVCAGCTHELYLKRTLTIPGVKVVFKVKNPKIAIFDVENPGLKTVAEGKLDAFLCAAPEGDGAIQNGLKLAGDQGARVLHVPDRIRGSLLVARRQGVRREGRTAWSPGLHADGSLRKLSIKDFFGKSTTRRRPGSSTSQTIGQTVK